MTKEKFNDLLCRIRKGNKDAFVILYNDFYPKMLYAAECITGNREDACDAVQQAFIKFWKYVIESDRPYLEYPNAYLYTITRKCAIDIVKINQKYYPYETMETLTTDDLYEEKEISRIDFKDAIKKLKDPEQTVAIQFFLFNMKIKEIAKNLDEPIGTIKWRISEIKKYLEKILK